MKSKYDRKQIRNWKRAKGNRFSRFIKFLGVRSKWDYGIRLIILTALTLFIGWAVLWGLM